MFGLIDHEQYNALHKEAFTHGMNPILRALGTQNTSFQNSFFQRPQTYLETQGPILSNFNGASIFLFLGDQGVQGKSFLS